MASLASWHVSRNLQGPMSSKCHLRTLPSHSSCPIKLARILKSAAGGPYPTGWGGPSAAASTACPRGRSRSRARRVGAPAPGSPLPGPRPLGSGSRPGPSGVPPHRAPGSRKAPPLVCPRKSERQATSDAMRRAAWLRVLRVGRVLQPHGHSAAHHGALILVGLVHHLQDFRRRSILGMCFRRSTSQCLTCP